VRNTRSCRIPLILLALLLAVPGCSSVRAPGVTSTAIVQTTLSSAAISGSATTASQEETAGSFVPLPSPTKKPTPTLKPSPAPTPKPTPTDSPDAGGGKVELAEGFYYIKLDAAIKKRITGLSYPADDTNIRIHYDDLRYIRLLHYDFSGQVSEGELIVNAKLADEVMEIFYELYQAKYPLTSVRLVDEYGEAANDDLSMAANNTSAFNYRFVSGTKTLSRHSYGAAIDINPMLNPYINNGQISPPNGAEYADRTRDFAGKIDHNDLCYKLFKSHGWSWGGDWDGDKDYQHFSKRL